MNEDIGVKTRTIKTTHFGEITISYEHIFTFSNGILGFEDLREFILISDEETIPFKWLVSIEKPEIGFPLLSPWHVDIEYDPGKEFNLEKQVLFVVVTLEDESGSMTANLKAPIVFNIKEQTGEQVILPKDKYLPNYVIRSRKANNI